MAYETPAVREREVRAYVRSRLGEKLSPAAIAAALGVNASYLNACFRARTGQCLTAYIHREKMRRACVLLRQTERPVAEICAMLGYFDQSHFTRVFKRVMGMTPGEYRQKNL